MTNDISPESLNRYAELIRQRWEDNAVEALVGNVYDNKCTSVRGADSGFSKSVRRIR